MFKVPHIPTPTVEISGFPKRYSIQEIYEYVKQQEIVNKNEYLLPQVPVDDLDFAWMLGVGTLNVEFSACLFIENGYAEDIVIVRSLGQCEYQVKPGIAERMGISFYEIEYIDNHSVVPSVERIWHPVAFDFYFFIELYFMSYFAYNGYMNSGGFADVWLVPISENLDKSLVVDIGDYQDVSIGINQGLLPVKLRVFRDVSNNYSLYDLNNNLVNNITFSNSQNWQVSVDGFAIVVASSNNISNSDKLLFYSPAYDSIGNYGLPPNTPNFKLNFVDYPFSFPLPLIPGIPTVCYRLVE